MEHLTVVEVAGDKAALEVVREGALEGGVVAVFDVVAAVADEVAAAIYTARA